jgi:hypothetical protein
MKEIKMENIEKIFIAEDGTLRVQMKEKDLSFDSIVDKCHGMQGWNQSSSGSKISKILLCEKTSRNFQFTQNNAKKIVLFSQILMICDWANDGEGLIEYYTITKSGIFKGDLGAGFPLFKSKELAEKAYNQNRALFEEFFKL